MIKYALYIKGLHVAFTIFRTRTAIFASILVYVLSGNILTARKVFVMTACFNTMRHTMTDFFTFAIEQLVIAKVSIKRIEKFLLQDENIVVDYKDKADGLELKILGNNKEEKSEKKVLIILKNVYASWNNNHTTNTLNNISLEIDNYGFTAVIGPVGSGKSSLLNLILKELTPNDGSVYVKGSISYASQEPWLFTASIKQNILFGNPFNETRYKDVLKLCSLEKDLDQFQYGDQTLVGDRGASLSGGQRIRINLARAIYNEADIYLLDDPFSALDSEVANEIYFNCVNSFLKNKICILITHQHQYLEQASEIILLDKGEIKYQGKYDSTRLELNDFMNLNDNHLTEHMMNKINKNCNEKETIVNMKKTGPTISEEQRKVGRVTGKTYQAYFQACGNSCYVFFVFSLFVLAQFFASSGDYFLKYW